VSALPYHEQVQSAAAHVRSTSATIPDVAIVLGSGLGGFASSLGNALSIPYGDIPNWPDANVVGHEGRLVIGEIAGRCVAALSGRAHFYEGHDLRTVTFATRVLGMLGVKTLILTNAAGGINTAFAPGDLMVIDDHINLLGSNPLVGPNDERFGVRFPDLTHVYSRRLRRLADDTAAAQGIALRHGVYAACHGPSYETPAEVRYLRLIGADAVGMSTVPEAIVARHIGMKILAISCVANPAADVSNEELSHAEVLAVMKESQGGLVRLLKAVLPAIAEDLRSAR